MNELWDNMELGERQQVAKRAGLGGWRYGAFLYLNWCALRRDTKGKLTAELEKNAPTPARRADGSKLKVVQVA